MTARDIQLRLMVDRYRRNLCCPNYTPRQWWECDLFEVTEAGYFNEYEIKLTRADFKADALKENREWLGGWGKEAQYKVENKHRLLAAGDPRGPSKFWYVVPKDLIAESEVPAWAGLIYCSIWQPRGAFKVQTKIVRPAPRLHRTKIDPKVVEHVNSIFYYRFANLFLFKRLENENETEKEATGESSVGEDEGRDQTAGLVQSSAN